MAPPSTSSASSITKAEFTSLLAQYPTLVSEISKSKGSKPGQKTLEQLDRYRYGDAVEQFGSKSSSKEMTHDDVKLLVEWKLRHGKFRPMLMNLVTSNDSSTTKKTIQQAIKTYRDSSGASSPPSAAVIAAALATLTKLKGIGPATASLLLTVHDPSRVIFFSDEAFYWLCGGGKETPIKYNNKEYEMLREEATALTQRLDVPATDVEKVAYVVMKQGKTTEVNGPATATPSNSNSEKPKPVKTEAPKRKSTAAGDAPKKDVKAPAEGVRRSKRVKS